MKFTSTLASLALFASVVFADSVSVSYDTTYDNAGQSLNTVACSDGSNGLISKGYSTFGSLHNFPNIGGAPAVAGWNSPDCGSCWQLQFNGRTVNVVAVDRGSNGFNIGLNAMNTLTGGQGQALGRVTAEVTRVDSSACGL